MSSSSERDTTAKPPESLASESNRPSFSIHPWYYVPGKSYLTEQRLSSKYNKESDRYRQNEEFNKYFMKCNSEAKLFANWQNSKPLVKYHREEHDSQSPFFVEEAAEKRQIEKSHYNKGFAKMSELLRLYEQSSKEYKQNFTDCTIVVKYLFGYMQIYKSVKEKRASTMTEMKRYLDQSLYNAIRNPLRQVCFLIKEILHFYKKEIFNIIKLLKSIYASDFLSEHDQTELDQLNNRCFQIIDMYIQLNDIRNDHFQGMFDEEREKAWDQQKNVWRNEIGIWDSLIIKLLQSNYLLITEKLNETLKYQKTYFENRLANFDQLKGYAREIEHDHILQPILYQSIEQLNHS